MLRQVISSSVLKAPPCDERPRFSRMIHALKELPEDLGGLNDNFMTLYNKCQRCNIFKNSPVTILTYNSSEGDSVFTFGFCKI